MTTIYYMKLSFMFYKFCLRKFIWKIFLPQNFHERVIADQNPHFHQHYSVLSPVKTQPYHSKERLPCLFLYLCIFYTYTYNFSNKHLTPVNSLKGSNGQTKTVISILELKITINQLKSWKSISLNDKSRGQATLRLCLFYTDPIKLSLKQFIDQHDHPLSDRKWAWHTL